MQTCCFRVITKVTYYHHLSYLLPPSKLKHGEKTHSVLIIIRSFIAEKKHLEKKKARLTRIFAMAHRSSMANTFTESRYTKIILHTVSVSVATLSPTRTGAQASPSRTLFSLSKTWSRSARVRAHA